jgi:hypothetical protein
MTPEQVAPLVSYLLGDQAHQISGQVFVVRGNEVMLMSQPRPIRTMALSDGWTIEPCQPFRSGDRVQPGPARDLAAGLLL